MVGRATHLQCLELRSSSLRSKLRENRSLVQRTASVCTQPCLCEHVRASSTFDRSVRRSGISSLGTCLFVIKRVVQQLLPDLGLVDWCLGCGPIVSSADHSGLIFLVTFGVLCGRPSSSPQAYKVTISFRGKNDFCFVLKARNTI